jgi:TonB family protein
MKKFTCSVQALLVVIVFTASLSAQDNQIVSEYAFWKDTSARSERFIRDRVIDRMPPQYPASSIEAKSQGEVIVIVVFDESGKVDFAKVVKSPDQAISEEVINAVKKWTFQPLVFNSQLRRVQGHLRFIFEIENGISTVSDAPIKLQKTKCVECNNYRLQVFRHLKATRR